jgi:serine/threonine protein kinase
MMDSRRTDIDQPATKSDPGPHADSLSLQPDSGPAADADQTAQAPSFAAPAATEPASDPGSLTRLKPGDRCGEFEIVDLLGRGGFGVVYLARETSLDRLVALKISPNVGSEGRNLAQLEHENIVQVYSEHVDVLRRQRLLCMQFVPGMTLGKLMYLWREQGSQLRTGPGIIQLLDQHKSRHARFDPTALRDRELLEDCDRLEAVCLLTARLAEALAHAHERNILHLDIKPNNILISQYGRPYLMDFNLSFQSVDLATTQPQLLGGTLPYMSPEHLEAFLYRDDKSRHRQLDARTDVFALGVVLFELLEGRLPFADGGEEGLEQRVKQMIVERRGQSGQRPRVLAAPRSLERVVTRCLEPAPDQRFASASDVKQELEGCRQQHRARREWLPAGWLMRQVPRHPWIWLVFIGLLPHLIGGVVQLSYNTTRIVHHLSAEQQALFTRLVIGFNPFLYSGCLLWMLAYIVPIFREWHRFQARGAEARGRIDAARRQVIDLPAKAALVGGVGWFCSASFFPMALHWYSGPLPTEAWIHFAISFLLAGSIAVAYGFILAQYIILRIFYPAMWDSARDFNVQAGRELARVERNMRVFQGIAGAIPFMGAVVMVSVGPDEFSAGEYGAFRLLVTLLILSGMAGARVAAGIGRQVSEMIRILSGFNR